MTAVIETVNIEDVFPLVDEYGNDMATRDYSTKENQAYVKELARSMRAKGIPDEMVTLVRDGGIYRVKAGNSRIRAMRELGTKTFPAIVEDEGTDQAILETVIRTNTKKKYAAVEESRFVRQLAMFGSDEYVSEVSGFDAEQVAKVRRAVEIVDDAADDMSLFRLAAIGEFAGDPEAVEELTNCAEKNFPAIEKRYKHEREVRRAREEIEAAAKARGITVADSRPDGYRSCGFIVNSYEIDKFEPGCVIVHSWESRYNVYTESVEEVDPEEETRQEEMVRRSAIAEAASEERESWFLEHLSEPMPELAAMEDVSKCSYTIEGFMNRNDLTVPENEYDRIYAFERNSFDRIVNEYHIDRYFELISALESAGYEPGKAERELYEIYTQMKEEEE